MKKTLLLFVIALAPFAGRDADARFVDKSEPAVLSVSDVSKMGDDQTVVMKGTIEKHLKKDKYQFVDSTGKIVVEIDGEDWRGIDVTPSDTVMIVGETDTDWFHDTQVDVKSIRVVHDKK